MARRPRADAVTLAVRRALRMVRRQDRFPPEAVVMAVADRNGWSRAMVRDEVKRQLGMEVQDGY